MESTHTNVLALAEYSGDETRLLHALDARGITYFVHPTIGCTRIKLFTDVPSSYFVPRRESDRYSIREFSRSGCETILLALVHLPSKLYFSENDQLQDTIRLRDEIERTEMESQNSNTVVVGDFNMNPFDMGMVSAMAMHSLACLRTAKLGGRVVRGKRFSFFYNPTWSLFGDHRGVPGTYYRSPSGYGSFYWNILDQVVLRPSIADRLDKESLRIITSTGKSELIDRNGRPAASDHLPLYFTLDLTIEGL